MSQTTTTTPTPATSADHDKIVAQVQAIIAAAPASGTVKK